ncbi:MAG: DNA-3-methyladenine glycosylase, partial [Flavobacteriales bacterium]|nr:DNA-3-methyladenine glycosylase [Flavobacteriales bacterium]
MDTKVKIPLSYYQQEDVVGLAKDLIGKVLCTNIQGNQCEGIITETEAYAGATDKASHAYKNLRTKRTETMYDSGGIAYVYLCYGIHHLFNVVCGPQDLPHAVLLRGIKPLGGVPFMEKRRHKDHSSKNFSSGPGTATMALGIDLSHNGTQLSGPVIWLEDRSIQVPDKEIIIGPRIGVDYAQVDA